MKNISIENLAYLLKDAKERNLPQPIFFLGAGASVTGGVPLAKEIAQKIVEGFSGNPFVCDEADKSYSKLMACLLPHQRNELLKDIIEEAKINVTHIYLAQLLKEGYVDYILTVNFDNLILRALSLYNIFPSTYDMAILKDLTTTSFKTKSTIYLHGQHHGLWLLNTKEEMDKVKNIVPRVFDSIKNERPWIFIGYSGTDPIFEHIKLLGRFDNGLYWVGYKENALDDEVNNFLSLPNTNAFHIKGYDADAFMLKLNESLGLPQPEILEKPFTSLLGMINNINDINDEDHFKGVRERLEITKRNIDIVIRQFEKNEIVNIDNNKLEVDKLKKEIIDIIITKGYDSEQTNQIILNANNLNNEELNNSLSDLYFNWGNSLFDLAELKIGKEAETLLNQAIEKYQKAIDSKSDFYEAFYNWGTSLAYLAKLKTDKEADDLYYQAFEKYRLASEIKPNHYQAFYNWGNSLSNLAELKNGKEAETLLNQAIEKYQKAIDFKSDYYQAFYNWGNSLSNLAELKNGKEAEDLYHQAIEKYKKAIDFKSDFYEASHNWGISLVRLAKLKTGKEAEDLYHQAIEKYKKAIDFKSDFYEAFYNWGNSLSNLAELKNGKEAEDLYHQAIEKYKKAIVIKSDFYDAYYNLGNALTDLAKLKTGKEAEDLNNQAFEVYNKVVDFYCYNLACLYAIKNMKKDALHYLDLALSRNEITANYVLEDEDWNTFKEDSDFMVTINKYKTN